MAHPFRLISTSLIFACVLGLLLPQLVVSAEVRKDMIKKQTDKLQIEVEYPVIGQSRVDADIADWARQLAENFENNYAEEPMPQGTPYELKATFTLSRPSKRAVTVTWDVASYTGGAHGNLDIITKTYNLSTGEPVDIYDLFKDLETALNHMSAYSYKALSETLGDMRVEDMLRGGTTPDADNFSSIALIPTGVRVYFQPYQVAPWAAGPQFVEIPLEELMDAEPQLELWNKQAPKP